MLAPTTLGLDTRNAFREQAFEQLSQLPEGGGKLLIDLTETRDVDSSGLGALLAVCQHANERGQRISLRKPNDEIRYLLSLTRLDQLVDIEK